MKNLGRLVGPLFCLAVGTLGPNLVQALTDSQRPAAFVASLSLFLGTVLAGLLGVVHSQTGHGNSVYSG
jgi:preprotein translocase subunit SecY